MNRGEMAGWHQRLNGHEFEQALEDGDGQGSLACCSPWGRKELDMTERLNSNDHCKALTRTEREGCIRLGSKPHPFMNTPPSLSSLTFNLDSPIYIVST